MIHFRCGSFHLTGHRLLLDSPELQGELLATFLFFDATEANILIQDPFLCDDGFEAHLSGLLKVAAEGGGDFNFGFVALHRGQCNFQTYLFHFPSTFERLAGRN